MTMINSISGNTLASIDSKITDICADLKEEAKTTEEIRCANSAMLFKEFNTDGLFVPSTGRYSRESRFMESSESVKKLKKAISDGDMDEIRRIGSKRTFVFKPYLIEVVVIESTVFARVGIQKITTEIPQP
jgi:protein-arginine kinase activator protein McsA